jgi:hypothetical protein
LTLKILYSTYTSVFVVDLEIDNWKNINVSCVEIDDDLSIGALALELLYTFAFRFQDLTEQESSAMANRVSSGE